jgi:hypothetical protein
MESSATSRQHFVMPTPTTTPFGSPRADYTVPAGASQALQTTAPSTPQTPARFLFPIAITPSPAPPNDIAATLATPSATEVTVPSTPVPYTTLATGGPTTVAWSDPSAAPAAPSNASDRLLAPGDPFFAVWVVKDPGTTVPPTGNDLRKWTVHQLRKQCAEYGVTIKRTGPDRKKLPEGEARAIALDKYLRAKQTVIEGIDSNSARTKNCRYRLMNVVFSDKFAKWLKETGARASREDLDTGSLNEKSAFWIAVTVYFNTNTTDYNDIILPEHSLFKSIDPSVIVEADAPQLVEMWKKVAGKYKKISGNFTRSGTHESEFFQFCQGANRRRVHACMVECKVKYGWVHLRVAATVDATRLDPAPGISDLWQQQTQ